MSAVIDTVAGKATKFFPVKPADHLPQGRMIDLPGRGGSTYVTDSAATGDSDPDAPAIILLHSVMTTGLMCWYATIPDLREHFRVITLDQRFHGRGITSGSFTLDDCADDTVAVADALGVDTFIAGGFSLGGGTAQVTWQRHPDRVDGLVLASTGPYFSGSRAVRADRVTRAVRAVTGRALSHIPPIKQSKLADTDISTGAWLFRQFRATRFDRLADISDGMADFDSRDWLGEIDVPTSVVVSTHDHTVSPKRQQILVDSIPQAHRFDVPAGHACCVLEPDLFAPKFTRAASDVAERVKSGPAQSRPA